MQGGLRLDDKRKEVQEVLAAIDRSQDGNGHQYPSPYCPRRCKNLVRLTRRNRLLVTRWTMMRFLG